MLALFTVLSLMTAAFTITALRQHLMDQLDTQLNAALGVETRYDSPFEDRKGPGTDQLEVRFTPASASGTAEDHGKLLTLTDAQLELIASADIGREGRTIDLGGRLGRFRVMATEVIYTNPIRNIRVSGTQVVGLSTRPTEQTIARMFLLAGSSVAAGVLIAGGLGTWIVRRNLEPLRRVAGTATRVSRLPLDTGQVALAERVAPEDTDRRTEVGQVGAAFNEMLDHVDEALNARHRSEQRVRQFVADASHELRTPLASIKGYAELSRREPDPVPESVSHAMGRIESEAGRMGSLVEDLLLLARLDAGRPLASEPVDLSVLVVNAVSDAHAAAPEHRWHLDLPPEPVEVSGDGPRLHQVVANLLANARTHTPAGTHVTTSVRPDGEWVRIAVHDNGPGVPDALQPNVFERFARGDNARHRVGGSTGLGLSIVAAVARAHGGRVEMTSRPGDTTFALLLPRS
jgi:two-component system OmpR family sensor kinase